MNIPTLTTPRLVLRPFTGQDVDALYRLMDDADVMRYFPNPTPPTREQVAAKIEKQSRHWQAHGYGCWAIEPRAQPLLAGWAGLQYLPETDEVEVAYMLGKPFWGQGWATEAARASLAYAFETLDVPFIVGIVHPDNVASRRVLEKMGLKVRERTEYFGMDCYRLTIERAE
jgi:ribosomal-protein-alanine N-acetyltransferase